MSFLPQRFRSKSVSTSPAMEENASQSCPNLLDLDDNTLNVNVSAACSKFAQTPSPDLMPLDSPSKRNRKSKKHRPLFLLPMRFRRAKERRAQTQALKLPVCSLMNLHSPSLEPPTNVRPKHTRPTGLGLGLGLGGLLGNEVRSSRDKIRRGSDPSPTSYVSDKSHKLSTVIERSDLDDDCNYLDGQQSCPNLLEASGCCANVAINEVPISSPPICIVVSSSDDRSGLRTDPYKRLLGKSLEQV